MKKLSKKGVLLFAGAMAICAFVMPSTASAASWGPTGLHTVLHSTDFGFTSTSFLTGPTVSSCTRSSFTANVVSAAILNISTASIGGHCTAIFPGIPATCTMTTAATSLSWRGTALTTSNITIDGVRLNLTYENTPGTASCGPVSGLSGVLIGRLGGGQWSGNSVGQRSVNFSNDEGLTLQFGVIASVATARGTIAATGALTVS